ncbi:MAG: branched-chain amino acid ABC transporter permease [Deltaproteobacteria bacterium]|nr:branched-chain amino acid ABC transporter permease [Deltaproteobacteria bacterium]
MNFDTKRKNSIYLAVLIILLFLVPLFLKSDYWLHVLSVAGINIMLTVSVHTIWCAGELLLGTAGIMALGAYSSAVLAMRLGITVWLAMLLGGVVCALFAVVLGNVFMRAKGIYFSILTLLSGEIIRLTAWYYRSLTGGPVGLSHIPPPGQIKIPGIPVVTFQSKESYY